jgi:ArsR family transcriptional regulator
MRIDIPMLDSKLDNILRAAGESTRLRILNLLRFGKICVSDLQSVLGLPQATVSRHLAILRNTGLVTDSRKGTRIVYSLYFPATPQTEALRELLDKCCPHDEMMWADFERFELAIRSGKCRVEPNDDATREPDKADSSDANAP